jgi:hypothetical protein
MMIWIRNADQKHRILKEVTTIGTFGFYFERKKFGRFLYEPRQTFLINQSPRPTKKYDTYDEISISVPEVYQILEYPRGQNPARSWSGGLQIWT